MFERERQIVSRMIEPVVRQFVGTRVLIFFLVVLPALAGTWKVGSEIANWLSARSADSENNQVRAITSDLVTTAQQWFDTEWGEGPIFVLFEQESSQLIDQCTLETASHLRVSNSTITGQLSQKFDIDQSYIAALDLANLKSIEIIGGSDDFHLSGYGKMTLKDGTSNVFTLKIDAGGPDFNVKAYGKLEREYTKDSPILLVQQEWRYYTISRSKAESLSSALSGVAQRCGARSVEILDHT